MKIELSTLPAGSFTFQIFNDKDIYGIHPYQISGVVIPLEDGGCKIVNVQGDMNNASNELMAITIRDLGFTHLNFYVPKGQENVTHYATFVESDEMFDWYTVPLAGQKTDSGQ